MGGALDLAALAVDVAGVFGGNLHLLHHSGGFGICSLHRQISRRVPATIQRHQPRVAHIRPAQQLGQAVFMVNGFAQNPFGFRRIQVFGAHPDGPQALCFT